MSTVIDAPRLLHPDETHLTPRGRARRAALLAALATHLTVTPWHEARITTVARMAGCSAASFYQHFTTLDAAARTLIRRLRAEEAELDEHLAAIALLLEVEQQLTAAP